MRISMRSFAAAVALTLALMLFPATAYAAETEQAVDAAIPVYVYLNSRNSGKDETFTIKLEALDAGAPVPVSDTLAAAAVAKDAAAPSGTFTIHYTVPGCYRYKVTQLPGTARRTVYDKTVYYVTVSMFYNGEDVLVWEAAARRDDPDTAEKADRIAFVNTYTSPVTPPVTPGTLIQTGQLNWPVPVLGGTGTGLLCAGCLLLRRRRERR